MLLPMKVHAVKIRYRERVLRQLPHGRFGEYRGKRHVFITYLPDKAEVSTRFPKRFSLTSKQGKVYAQQIEQYIKIKAEYDRLLADWRTTYVFEPPEVRFPIVQTYDPHCMNNKFFERAHENTNDIQVKHPVYSGDNVLKSKNEQFGKGILQNLSIPFKYEADLDIENPEGITPDYLLSFFEIDRCIYAEICGMSDKYDYSVRLAHKINFYSNNYYRQGREIIYCYMYDKYNFDEENFAMQVLGAYNTLIPDSAIDWDNYRPPEIE